MSLVYCKSSRDIIFLISLTIILIQFLVEPVISMPCPLSEQFIQYVDRCPRNSLEWNARSAIYNCSSVNQTCVQNDMFVYHCVLNSNGTMLIEVCAPLKYIYGHKCTEFDSRGNIIQENSKNCSKDIVSCPKAYISTDAFKYQSCFDEIKEKTNFVAINGTNNSKSECNRISAIIIIITLAATNAITIVLLIRLQVMRSRENNKLSYYNTTSEKPTTKEYNNKNTDYHPDEHEICLEHY